MLSKRDPRLGALIRVVRSKVGVLRPGVSKASPFEALVRGIVYQRMAGKAAGTIYERLRDEVGQRFTPERVLALPDRALRGVGLSAAKAGYVRNVARWFEGHRGVAKRLERMGDEEIREALTGVEGTGRWTVNVLLIF